MTIEQLTTFLAWNSVIHIGLLLLATLMLMFAGDWITGLHKSMFAVEKEAMNKIYVAYLSAYKLLILVFCLVPYLVLQALY